MGIDFIFDQKHSFGYWSSKCLVTIIQICKWKCNTLHITVSVGVKPIILANGHWLHWQSCSFNITMSPTSKLFLLSFHFCLLCKLCRNSFLHLCQNFSAICCTCVHLLLEYRSGLMKTPGGVMTAFVFIVNRLLGESGIWLLVSLKVSTVRGLKLIIDCTYATKVLSVSLFNDWPCVFSNPSKIPLAVWIWRSHTPPICDAPGGFLFYKIQSVLSPWPYWSNWIFSCQESAQCHNE